MGFGGMEILFELNLSAFDLHFNCFSIESKLEMNYLHVNSFLIYRTLIGNVAHEQKSTI